MRIPAHVRHETMPDGGVVVLDCADGQWYVFNSGARDFWQCWASGRSLAQSVAAVADRHPDLPRERITADGTALLRQLTALGLVEAEGEGRFGSRSTTRGWAARFGFGEAPSRVANPLRSEGAGADPGAVSDAVPGAVSDAGTRARPMARRRVMSRRHPAGPRRPALAPPVALLGAALAVRLPFAVVHRAVRATRGRWASAPEDPRRADEYLAALRHTARRFPGRAACLEISLAAVLLSAAHRRRLDWCLGAAPDPFRFHAWVACDGAAVAASLSAPEEDGEPPLYHAVLTV
ncbi:lasso peptide biosynthesis B2 protein [Embleya sp. NPDC059237]|uniref:lasso peptide biosynthesis B2 protein n=1 Tax=Embleya sp. NPDC059237 TaxID=3346784 RepID=UPI0036B31C85